VVSLDEVKQTVIRQATMAKEHLVMPDHRRNHIPNRVTMPAKKIN
jgi:hypothetical protein